MSLRVDRRARIPFAVLGALLLLTSTLYATTATPGLVREPVAPELVDGAQTQARVALGTAVRDAGRRAARRPVLDPASTAMGSLLDGSAPFERYLALLVALEAREELASVRAERNGVAATVRLPSIESTAGARRAMEDVSITRVPGGRYRVHVSGLQVDVERQGRPTDAFEYETNLTVPIPALLAHERVQAFEHRLHAGLTEPGFARDLTARLFPVTWARGYAQYGGAPIKNVLANRHVAVLANDALLAQQTAVFGRSDADARRATRRAATNVFVRDGLHLATEAVKAAAQQRIEADNRTGPSPAGGYPMPSAFDRERTYHVDRTADETFLDFADDGGGLDAVLDRLYRAQVRADAGAAYRGSRTTLSGRFSPGATLFTTRTETRRWLANGDWHAGSGRTLRRFDGRVIEERTTTRYWLSNRTLETTTLTQRTRYHVDVDLRYRYRPPGIAPERRIAGRPFGRAARSRLRRRAMATVVDGRGGIDELAVHAVGGSDGSRWESVDIEPPRQVRRQAYRETADLREQVHSVSVSLRPRSIASSANPASLLAEELRDRERAFVDAPARYRSVADRAVVAARVEYLHRLQNALARRSPLLDRVQQRLVSTIDERAIPLGPPRGGSQPLSGIASSVDARPDYLSVRADGDRSPAMAARNVNVFAVPYGDAADTITAGLFDGGSDSDTSLRTAAKTLSALEALPPARVTPDVRSSRTRLRAAVGAAVHRARPQYQQAVARETSRRLAEHAVAVGYAGFDGDSERALAISDGRMAGAIATAATDRGGRTRDLLRVRLSVVSARLREDTAIRVDDALVGAARDSLQTATNDAVSDALHQGAVETADAVSQRYGGEAVSALPAGLPLLPVPGYWYATANVWVVQVRGAYDRFEVRIPRASPARSTDGTLSYVRERSTVSIDVDGDGRPDRLGRNRPVTLAADTGVLVVVPPGGSGVGDVDGNADERSPGWGRLDV